MGPSSHLARDSDRLGADGDEKELILSPLMGES